MNRKSIEAFIRNDYDWIWPPKRRKTIVNKKSGKDKLTGSSYEKAIRWEVSKICNELSFCM